VCVWLLGGGLISACFLLQAESHPFQTAPPFLLSLSLSYTHMDQLEQLLGDLDKGTHFPPPPPGHS